MPLDRKTIIDAALTLLNETGLEGLSMRRIAQALDVQAPAIYWHFPGKQALLEGMADALLAGVADRIDSAASSQHVLGTAMAELRRALLARRDGARLLAGTFAALPQTLQLADALVQTLQREGRAAAPALSRIFPLIYFVLGFVIEEQAFAEQRQGERLQNMLGEAQALGHGELGAALQAYLAKDPDQRFMEGIAPLLRDL